MMRKGQVALEYLLITILNLLIATIAICLILKNPSNTHVANSTMQAYDQLLNQSLQVVQNYLNSTP